MKRVSFSHYRRVYGLLLGTYGKSWHVRASFLMALVSRVSKFILLPIFISQLIASLAAGDYDQAREFVVFAVLASASMAVLAPLTRYVALLGENHIYDNLLSSYFNKLLAKDVRYFNDSMAGYITTASRQFGDNGINLVRKARESYLSTLFAMVVPVVVICFYDFMLGALVFILGATQAVYLIFASRKVAPYRVRQRETYKRVSGLISDSITNIIAIKATAQEAPVARRVADEVKHETELFIERMKLQSKMVAGREVITVTFFLVLFWMTVSQLSGGAISVATAVLVITYSMTIMTAIYDLTDALDEHDDLVDKIIPALDVVEDDNTIKDPARPHKLDAVKGSIGFNNVTFAYEEGDSSVPVFKGLSLAVEPGQKVGVVGLSGAGKSTLAKLLLRFEEVQDGDITIDGINIKQVRQTDLRRTIAYVPQEPLLFHDTIFENIRLAKLDATEAEVMRAAELAHAKQFITSLPNGFTSVVGERGVKLSGGQKQRIAIARAVLQNAPIIVLDEATSALDSESEQIVKDSFSEIFKKKTAIVIAHRLSTLADLDRIVLLHDGEVIEDGSHSELLKKKGIYARLWNRQQLRPEDLEVARDTSLEQVT